MLGILHNKMMKKELSYIFTAVLASVICCGFTIKIKMEADPLHKRIFNISLSETKKDIVAKKNISDQMYFKNGFLYSDFLRRKFGYKHLKYRINKDSIFTDFTDTEVRLLEVEAVITDEKNQTIFVDFSVSEWDIGGVIKITKNDKLKRYYDFTGREKGGKPKKKKKQRELESDVLN
jgi:hypothetical protein